MRPAYLLSVLLTALLLTGCATNWNTPSQQIKTQERFTVEMPEGWLTMPTRSKNGTVASLDGPLLQRITVYFEDYKKAFAQTKQKIDGDTLSFELMEYYIAEIKSRGRGGVFEVLSKEAIQIDGNDAFKVTVQFKNQDGLRVRVVAIGFGKEDGMYLLTYIAPVLYYFDKNIQDFEKTAQTFRLTQPNL